MTFQLREHPADVAIEAECETLGATFAALGDGLGAAQCEDIPDTGERFPVEVRAESREALLFDFLDRLIYERDVRGVLPDDHEATVTEGGDEWVVRASARGVPLEDVSAREVKAVTYSEMQLEAVDGGWNAYVVLDV